MSEQVPKRIVTYEGFRVCHCGGCGCNCGVPRGEMHDYESTYKQLLSLLHPQSVLEWGPGRNTELALEAGAVVWSVESNPQWLLAPTQQLTQLLVLEKSLQYTTPTVWLRIEFSLVFVDGRKRAECLRRVRVSSEAWTRGTVVAVHDAQRARYWDGLKRWAYIVVPEGSLAMATDDEDTYRRILTCLSVGDMRHWSSIEELMSRGGRR